MSSGAVELSPAPADGVTRVQYSTCGRSVLVSSWSSEVAIHAVEHGAQIAGETLSSPVLDATWSQDGKTIYAAGLNGTVTPVHLTEAATMLSQAPLMLHEKAASCVCALENGIVVSGGWDTSLRMRSANANEDNATHVATPGKIFAMCKMTANSIAAVTSAKKLLVLDTRRPDNFVYNIDPAPGAPLRTVSASPNRPTLVLGCTDGRVAVESIDSASAKSFAFKCHRADGRAYPVNAVVHSQTHGTFATGGGDGHVCTWDGVARKRIFQYPRAATSIASIDLAPDESHMAVAVSYTFEEGQRDHPRDTVLLRPVAPSEIQPKRTETAKS